MSTKLPIGISDFKELITPGDYLFADKSLFIEDTVKDGSKIILITRPRRFGKTLNLSMLRYFFDLQQADEDNLFEGLDISKNLELCNKYQSKYPVIFITFKDVKADNYEKAYAQVSVLLRQLYAQHRYLLDGDFLYPEEKKRFEAILNDSADLARMQEAIKQLSIYLARKFNKPVILLIDEYDTPIQEAYVRDYYNEMVELIRGIFGQALKDNEHLWKAVLTGITRISQESMFSGLNNIEVYSLLREEYGQYFGFTKEEVKELSDKSKTKVSLNSIKEWYNGYKIGKYVLYNPWSIISCLKNKGQLEAYWVNTSSNDLVGKLLRKAKPLVKEQLQDLLQGNIIEQPLSENLVFPNIEKREEALWTLLLYAGYLKVLSRKLVRNHFVAKLAIPNKEVGLVYGRMVEEWFGETISLASYYNFVESLIAGNIPVFKQHISDYIMQSGSYFDFNKNTPEQVFHVFILGLVVGLRDYYYINSNQESGKGRFDVLFLPKDTNKNGILLEFKTCDRQELLVETANEALTQIKNKQYTEKFKQHGITNILAIGIAFCGKNMDLLSENINCE